MNRQVFFVIGAQRAGSTSLAHLLALNRGVQVLGLRPPEPRLFLRDISPGRAMQLLMSEAGSDVLWIGEKATTYFERPEVATRISSVAPDAPVLAVLRNPVERAVSNYEFSVANGLESLSVGDALTDEACQRPWDRARFSTSPFHYFQRSHYRQLLKPWCQTFPHIQIHILEELTRSSARVEAVFEPFKDLGSRRSIPMPLRNTGDATRVVVPASLRRRLIDRFTSDIEAVEQLLGRAIPEWHQ